MDKPDTYTQRRSNRSKSHGKAIALVLAIILLLSIFAVYAMRADKNPQNSGSVLTADASCLIQVSIPDETPQIIAEYTGFTVSFNPAHHQPNYVAWELTRDEAGGDIPRNSNFRPDNDIYGCATLDDYRRSGFDRGHMAPAADMKWSAQAMADCHYLTNICPQEHSINGGRWSTLEKLSRQWADRDSALIIICGPVLSDELNRSIGQSGVTVPDRFFKVILAPYAQPPAAIAFIVPNHPTDDGIEAMATSVDQIETITGFDFFACLPDSLENVIEAQANFRHWNKRKTRRQ